MGSINWKRTPAGNVLWLGSSGGMHFGGSDSKYWLKRIYTDKLLQTYVTCASVNASTSFEPVLFYTTLTGVGQVGGRVRAFMTANVALGGWANALKGEVTFGAAGCVTGLGSAVVAEMTLSAGCAAGNYALFEGELNVPTGAHTGAKTGLIFLSMNGADVATAVTNAHLMTLNGFGTAGTGSAIFHTVTNPTATHALRVSIDGVAYDILMKAATYGG